MHRFSLESNEKEKVFILLALMSIIVSLLISKIFYILQIEIPWWFDAPSVMGFYGLFLSWFNFYLWKAKLIRKIIGIQTPLIAGEWSGFVKSEFDNYEKEHSASLNIMQTWSQISLCLKTGNSESKSTTMHISKMHESYNISFAYMNYPKPSNSTALLPHRGFAFINYDISNNLIEGEYFTDRFRKNNGLLHFTKLNK